MNTIMASPPWSPKGIFKNSVRFLACAYLAPLFKNFFWEKSLCSACEWRLCSTSLKGRKNPKTPPSWNSLHNRPVFPHVFIYSVIFYISMDHEYLLLLCSFCIYCLKYFSLFEFWLLYLLCSCDIPRRWALIFGCVLFFFRLPMLRCQLYSIKLKGGHGGFLMFLLAKFHSLVQKK